jgi:hypothetical protein
MIYPALYILPLDSDGVGNGLYCDRDIYIIEIIKIKE